MCATFQVVSLAMSVAKTGWAKMLIMLWWSAGF